MEKQSDHSGPQQFQNFADFYKFYLSEHSDLTCRRLHFVGSALVLITLVAVLVTAKWLFLFTLPVIGYGFAWVGHFMFEKNRPATFSYPIYSFMGDWVMFKDILTGRIKF